VIVDRVSFKSVGGRWDCSLPVGMTVGVEVGTSVKKGRREEDRHKTCPYKMRGPAGDRRWTRGQRVADGVDCWSVGGRGIPRPGGLGMTVRGAAAGGRPGTDGGR
jgi:hypothetical protein